MAENLRKKSLRWNFDNMPEDLDAWLRGLAKRDGVSLKAMVVQQLRATQGLRESHAKPTQAARKNGVGENAQLVLKPEENRAQKDVDFTDPRHGLVRELIWKRYEDLFKVVCPWDGSEAGQLGLLLRANPNWMLPDMMRAVEGYFMSEGVTPARPSLWLGKLNQYAAGPLDRFGKARQAEQAAVKPNPYGEKPPPMATVKEVMRRQDAEARAQALARGEKRDE